MYLFSCVRMIVQYMYMMNWLIEWILDKIIFIFTVFKSLGSNGSCEFGSLGISWQTSENSQVDSTKPTIGGGPNYMPMAWDPMKRGESTLLAAILSGSGEITCTVRFYTCEQ